jgi:homoserine kinase type II
MAVYDRRTAVLQGHRRGRGELQLPAAHDGGSYILTLYEKRVNPADLPFFLGLMQHLEKGIAARCRCARDGAVIGELAGRPAAIITFLEGMWMRRPTVEHCREVGARLAGMHLAGQDFPLTRPTRCRRRLAPLWDKGARPRRRGRAGAGAPEVEADLDEIWKAQLAARPAAGVIHADLFPDNVFFLGKKLSGLIDFYFACNDLSPTTSPPASTPGASRRTTSFNLTKGMALLSATTRCGRCRQPKEALPMLARGSALRFMLTRLYDWLNTPAGSLVSRRTRSNICAACASTGR